jgi:hypothetical protein
VKKRHITWDIFQKNYIAPAVPAVYTLPDIPSVRFYVADEARKVGVQIYLESPITIPPVTLKEISIELKYLENKPFVDFSTTNLHLFQPFYSLMISISDLVQLRGVTPLIAIEKSIEELKRITATIPLLAEEKVLGVWGELWVLERLIIKHGIEAVYSWKGPDRSVHDFRHKNVEVEVKTTRNEEREHVISRLSQLEASPRFSLWLCSIQVVSSHDSGKSLPEYVTRIIKLLNNNDKAVEYFENQLEKEGYKLSDADFYTTKYYLRTDPKLIEVDKDFVCLKRELIESRYADMASRITDVSYRLNVNGLGIDCCNQKFIELLGGEDADD